MRFVSTLCISSDLISTALLTVYLEIVWSLRIVVLSRSPFVCITTSIVYCIGEKVNVLILFEKNIHVLCIYIYKYIDTYRERERERKSNIIYII